MGAYLSGGLDSSSVAALAARELRAVGKVLPALSSVPRFDTNGLIPSHCFGDETPFIEATSRQAAEQLCAEAVAVIAAVERR